MNSTEPFFGVGQVGDEVLGGLQGRAAGDLISHAQVAGDARGKGGFAQARRPGEKDVPQRLAAFGGRVHDDLQPGVHLALPDHFGHALRAQIAVVVSRGGRRLEDRFAAHGLILVALLINGL